MNVLDYKQGFTPAGAGLAGLALPGFLISMAARDRLLVAVALGAAIALVIDFIWAFLALRRVSVVASAPGCADVGAPIGITIALSGRSTPLECAVRVKGVSDWNSVAAPSSSEIIASPTGRGVYDHLEVELSTTVPLGLVVCVRPVRVALSHPLHVAPKAEPTTLGPREATGSTLPGRRGTEPIGVRPYAPGDAPRDMHWPSVARTGVLLVRDRPGEPTIERVRVVVDDNPSDDFERRLGMARAVVEQLLKAGHDVVLVTQEVDSNGPMIQRVIAGGDLVRRLARAVEPKRGVEQRRGVKSRPVVEPTTSPTTTAPTTMAPTTTIVVPGGGSALLVADDGVSWQQQSRRS